MTNQKLSVYVLTKNSEKYLALVLQQVKKVADEIVIIDSGSVDKTVTIAQSIPSLRFIYRAFDNFASQRNFAASQCHYDWILFVDADEILNDEAVTAINELKKIGFQYDAYTILRNWIVLGKPIRSLYPIVSPDHPLRLFNRKITSFQKDARRVHETPTGYQSCGVVSGSLQHFTFNSLQEIKQKLQHYTDLASADLLGNISRFTYLKYYLSPIGAWIKFYLIKGGYRDGKVGLILGKYAYDYTKIKYAKVLKLLSTHN